MSWIAVFLGFCFLIVIHEAGHFLAAKAVGMRVERFFLFFGPTIWSFKRGETEYGIKSIPIGGYVKITGMNPEEDVPPEHEANAYYRKPVWKRIVVVAAGPAVNIVLAFAILFGVYWASGKVEAARTVEKVEPGTPAAKILRPGDRILAIDGYSGRAKSANERSEKFSEIVRSHRCSGAQVDGCVASTPVTLTLEHGGQAREVKVFPRYDKELGFMRIGFSYEVRTTPVGAGSAASEAGRAIWEVASGTAHVVTHLFESQQRKQVSGVVGISDVGHQVVERGLEKSLLLLALVSLSLGLINLLPILPLDGGHILWAVVEKLRRGRPVSLRVIERATVIGFALVLMLMVIGLTNDIGRITGEGFNVR
ncbi:MAG TPA: site-2 protease family protein [Solirubrobacterales bacterium]|jgi:regulator of sigma E protease|nr:site-2 protease family protein [Solirubrobacterales bacterium]